MSKLNNRRILAVIFLLQQFSAVFAIVRGFFFCAGYGDRGAPPKIPGELMLSESEHYTNT